MTTDALRRLRAWLTDGFTCDFQAEAPDAVAEDTRWGWLPALSGVALGAEQARAVHAETPNRGSRIRR